jgi:hypothetical protein
MHAFASPPRHRPQTPNYFETTSFASYPRHNPQTTEYLETTGKKARNLISKSRKKIMQRKATNFIRKSDTKIKEQHVKNLIRKSNNGKKRRQTSLTTDYYRPFSTYSFTYCAATAKNLTWKSRWGKKARRLIRKSHEIS